MESKAGVVTASIERGKGPKDDYSVFSEKQAINGDQQESVLVSGEQHPLEWRGGL